MLNINWCRNGALGSVDQWIHESWS